MAHDRVWMEDAACLDIELQVFYPRSHKIGRPLDVSEAKAICLTCPVKKTCLAFSIAHNIPYGVWGGWSWTERKNLSAKTKKRIRKAWFKLHPVRPLSHSIGAYGTIRGPYSTTQDIV